MYFLMIYEELILACSAAYLVKRIVGFIVHSFVLSCGVPMEVRKLQKAFLFCVCLS
jgi:hypothetical protein